MCTIILTFGIVACSFCITPGEGWGWGQEFLAAGCARMYEERGGVQQACMLAHTTKRGVQQACMCVRVYRDGLQPSRPPSLPPPLPLPGLLFGLCCGEGGWGRARWRDCRRDCCLLPEPPSLTAGRCFTRSTVRRWTVARRRSPSAGEPRSGHGRILVILSADTAHSPEQQTLPRSARPFRFLSCPPLPLAPAPLQRGATPMTCTFRAILYVHAALLRDVVQ